MGKHERVSTGIAGFDDMIDMLRMGDNVVWQVDSIADYREMVAPYVAQAKNDQREIVYIRFGSHEPVLENLEGISYLEIDSSLGFETFTMQVRTLITEKGYDVFYVFDSLTDLLTHWYSDLMIGNFFQVTCPYLFELNTIAYFAIIRNKHSNDTIARIRETTQVLLELYKIEGNFYIHPLKVWQRYSPTMFLPHLLREQDAISITASTETAELFSSMNWSENRQDFWEVTLQKCRDALTEEEAVQEKMKCLLIQLLVGKRTRIYELCVDYFKLSDLVKIADREIGTGFIGGKSVGMLLARRIITRTTENHARFKPILEPNDSFYLGSDIFYTYIVQNGLWTVRTKQKTKEGYFTYAAELKQKILEGVFPNQIEESFIRMLQYYGQSPIIVRSSSLLEDNFGNAFAGKYESIFCVNQGTPEERLTAFEDAVKTVYASTMNEDALQYRLNRKLDEADEQMAILVQRVSGDYYGDYFFPHMAGVGNSSNLYVWDENIDMDAGMVRLVFGLGTRAVDRIIGDYAKIVALDDPSRKMLVEHGWERKFSQHYADVLDLKHNELVSIDIDQAMNLNIKTDRSMFGQIEYSEYMRLRELGYKDRKPPYLIDFKKLLEQTDYPEVLRDVLHILSETYQYPVDIEFTTNFREDGSYRFNLLQCRPLQTRGLGKTIEMPKIKNQRDCIFYSKKNFMGGNVRLPLDYIIYVDAKTYAAETESEKYSIARKIGMLNEVLKEKNVMLMGPGRFGTTTPSLGVPVHFTELCHMQVMCEYSSPDLSLMPELSYGSHFFQDLVETGIFYVALFGEEDGIVFRQDTIEEKENLIAQLVPHGEEYQHVIRVVDMRGVEVYSDITSQTVVCC